jgi:hypothetical protein
MLAYNVLSGQIEQVARVDAGDAYTVYKCNEGPFQGPGLQKRCTFHHRTLDYVVWGDLNRTNYVLHLGGGPTDPSAIIHNSTRGISKEMYAAAKTAFLVSSQKQASGAASAPLSSGGDSPGGEQYGRETAQGAARKVDTHELKKRSDDRMSSLGAGVVKKSRRLPQPKQARKNGIQPEAAANALRKSDFFVGLAARVAKKQSEDQRPGDCGAVAGRLAKVQRKSKAELSSDPAIGSPVCCAESTSICNSAAAGPASVVQSRGDATAVPHCGPPAADSADEPSTIAETELGFGAAASAKCKAAVDDGAASAVPARTAPLSSAAPWDDLGDVNRKKSTCHVGSMRVDDAYHKLFEHVLASYGKLETSINNDAKSESFGQATRSPAVDLPTGFVQTMLLQLNMTERMDTRSIMSKTLAKLAQAHSSFASRFVYVVKASTQPVTNAGPNFVSHSDGIEDFNSVAFIKPIALYNFLTVAKGRGCTSARLVMYGGGDDVYRAVQTDPLGMPVSESGGGIDCRELESDCDSPCSSYPRGSGILALLLTDAKCRGETSSAASDMVSDTNALLPLGLVRSYDPHCGWVAVQGAA